MFLQNVQDNTCSHGKKIFLVKFLYASLREGDGAFWRDQINEKGWLHRGDMRSQLFITSEGYMRVGPPCLLPLRIDESNLASSLPVGSAVALGDGIAALGWE